MTNENYLWAMFGYITAILFMWALSTVVELSYPACLFGALAGMLFRFSLLAIIEKGEQG